MERCVGEVLDGTQEAIYITDMERNLLYANKKARELGKAVFQKEFSNAKCHEVLLGRSTPCPFCRLDRLSEKAYTVRNLRYIVVYTKVSKEFSLYQEMLNISNNGLLVTDQNTHEVCFANIAAQKILQKLPGINGKAMLT